MCENNFQQASRMMNWMEDSSKNVMHIKINNSMWRAWTSTKTDLVQIRSLALVHIQSQDKIRMTAKI